MDKTPRVVVIGGGVAGAFLADVFEGRQGWSGLIFLTLSFVGLIFTFGITKVPASNPAKKFRANAMGDLLMQGRLIRKDRVLSLAILGNSYFWFLGALLTANIVFYGSDVLHVSSTRTGILQAAVAIGIGLGSLAAGYLSGGKVDWGKFTFDMALAVVMKKVAPGEKMEKAILARLGTRAVEKVGEKVAKEAVAKVLALQMEVLLKKSLQTSQKILSGKDVSWDKFTEEVQRDLTKEFAIEVAKSLLKK